MEHCGDEFPEDELAARLIEVLACVEEAERILTQLSQLAVKSGNFWGGRGEFLRKLSDWAPRFGLVQT